MRFLARLAYACGIVMCIQAVTRPGDDTLLAVVGGGAIGLGALLWEWE